VIVLEKAIGLHFDQQLYRLLFLS